MAETQKSKVKYFLVTLLMDRERTAQIADHKHTQERMILIFLFVKCTLRHRGLHIAKYLSTAVTRKLPMVKEIETMNNGLKTALTYKITSANDVFRVWAVQIIWNIAAGMQNKQPLTKSVMAW